MNHHDWTLAAVDDVIARGRMNDWKELREAVDADDEVRIRVLRVCAAYLDDPYAQRYHFWDHYAHQRTA